MKYNRISTKFWTDEKVLQWDNKTRLLALYLLTCPHKNTEGLFRLPKQYICADLGWSLEGLAKPFNKLLADGFIKYDERVKVILLTRALKYQSPDNPNQEKAAISLLKELPETGLLADFIRQAKRYSQRFYQRLVKQFGKPQALSLTPTLSLTQDNNNRPDSEKSQATPARKFKSSTQNILEDSSRAATSNNEQESAESQSQTKTCVQPNENKASSEKDSKSKSSPKNTFNRKNADKTGVTADKTKNNPTDKPEENTDTVASGNSTENITKNKFNAKKTQKLAKQKTKTVKFDRDSKAYQTCCFLIDRIIDNNPRARVPNKDPTNSLLQKWCQELDRLHRLGPVGARAKENKGYSWQEIWQLINWCQQHQFWQSNILSASSLRKQVTKLENQMKQFPANEGQEKMELLKEVYLEAQEDDTKGGFDPL